MIIFASNSILNFKTKIIPKDSIIIPIEKYKLKNAISTITQIKPCKIICENEKIRELLNPHFNNLELLNNQPSHIYINNQIPQNLFYIIISLLSSICFWFLSKNTVLTLIFFTTTFIILLFSYSESTRWDKQFHKLIDL